MWRAKKSSALVETSKNPRCRLSVHRPALPPSPPRPGGRYFSTYPCCCAAPLLPAPAASQSLLQPLPSRGAALPPIPTPDPSTDAAPPPNPPLTRPPSLSTDDSFDPLCPPDASRRQSAPLIDLQSKWHTQGRSRSPSHSSCNDLTFSALLGSNLAERKAGTEQKEK
jgi:hypothetical protein